MKMFLSVLMIFMFSNCFAQNFKLYEIKRLNLLGIEVESNNTISEDISQNLHSLLEKENRRRKYNAVGIILALLGTLSTSVGFNIVKPIR